MAKLLVTMENSWYNEIGSLKNYNEKSIERRLLKNGHSIFRDFYSSLCNFEFSNPAGSKSDPDIVLISKDFKKWVLIEVELISKGMGHTFTQLEVFTDCRYDIKKLINYLQRHIPALINKDGSLNNLFKAQPQPDVLVIFDGYNEQKIASLQQRFNVNIASIEVFKTEKHSGEALMIYGDYPYQVAGYTFLKPVQGDFVHFNVSNLSFFLDPRIEEIEASHNFKSLKLTVIRSNRKKDILVKIPFNPFEPAKALILERTITKQYFIKPL